jgi:hypothetical protein
LKYKNKIAPTEEITNIMTLAKVETKENFLNDYEQQSLAPPPPPRGIFVL